MKLIPLRLGPQSLSLPQGAAPSGAATAGGEAALLARARAGDKAAVAAIYRRYVDEVFGYAFNQLGERQEAEDVTSEVFLRLVRALPEFRGDSSLRTWIYSICRNILRDRWRERASHPRVPLDLVPARQTLDREAEPAGGSAADATRAGDLSALGRAVLARLSPREQAVLALRFLEGRSVADTAAELGLSPGNLKVIQHRALRHAARIAAELAAAAETALGAAT